MIIAKAGTRRWVRRVLLACAILFALITVKAWRDTTADPLVRQARIAVPGLPGDTASVKIVLMTDLHVAGPDMPPARLSRIVDQVNALRPDYVFVGGDLISDKRFSNRSYSLHDAVAPLADVKATYGVFAVLGNHDHWRDAAEARRELAAIGAMVLSNSAVRRGPLTIGGLDDDFTGHADSMQLVRSLHDLGGAPVILSHSPDPFPALPPETRLMFAGHTHCGQIRLPLVGAVTFMSRYGDRYACGRIDEAGRTLFVSAGLGTSVLPFRFGTRPDIWEVTVSPAGR